MVSEILKKSEGRGNRPGKHVAARQKASFVFGGFWPKKHSKNGKNPSKTCEHVSVSKETFSSGETAKPKLEMPDQPKNTFYVIDKTFVFVQRTVLPVLPLAV